MASKRGIRRKSFKKSCQGKIKFPRLDVAEKAAVSHQIKYGRWMTAYACRHCGTFHIGHPPRRVRQSIKDRQAARKQEE